MGTLFNEIEYYAKQGKTVKVYFDMDGVLTPYDISEENHPAKIKYGYYTNKTPLTAPIEYAKKVSEIPNVQVHILSSCCYKNQIDEKKDWIKKYANFFNQENINIVCLEDYDLNITSKHFIKASILNNDFLNSDCIIFFIDDDSRNLKEARKSGNIKVYHVSSLFEDMKLK